MYRRIAASVLFLVPFFVPAVASAAAPATNVLLVIADDLNTELGCYGNRAVSSPNIDRIASRGVRFDRAYVQYPLCNPSRVSFLSGRRPETSGVYVLNTSARTALPDAVMLPQFFRQQGYYTAGAGKVFHSVKMGDPASWDSYEDGNGEDEGEQAAIQARYGGGDGRPRWHVLATDGAKTRDGLNARTIQRLIAEKSAAGTPFFLALGFHKPHLPWTAPKKFFDLYPAGSVPPPVEPALRDIPPIALQTELSGFEQPESRDAAIRAYYACISFIDAELGRVLAEFDRHDLWRNTLIVLVGDNGFHLGDHGGLWAKLSAFDQANRVPFLLAGPGVPAGRVFSSPVELLDIYPTLADLAGFSPPKGLEGKSLRPFLAQTRAPGFARTLVYHYDVAANRDVPGRTLIGEQWRYTEWEGGRAGRELYWRADDPWEYHNRADDPALAAPLREARGLLQTAPPPKPGPANRPRALDRDTRKARSAPPLPTSVSTHSATGQLGDTIVSQAWSSDGRRVRRAQNFPAYFRPMRKRKTNTPRRRC